MSEATRARHAEFARELPPHLQEIYVSLLGPEVWRMYRDGMNRGYLLDLYATDNEFDDFFDGILLTLPRLLHPTAYGSLDAVSAYIDGEVAKLAPGNRLAFSRHGYLVTARIPDVLDAGLADPRVMNINRVATTMLDSVYEDMDPEVFVRAITPIWLTLCDKALEISD